MEAIKQKILQRQRDAIKTSQRSDKRHLDRLTKRVRFEPQGSFIRPSGINGGSCGCGDKKMLGGGKFETYQRLLKQRADDYKEQSTLKEGISVVKDEVKTGTGKYRELITVCKTFFRDGEYKSITSKFLNKIYSSIDDIVIPIDTPSIAKDVIFLNSLVELSKDTDKKIAYSNRSLIEYIQNLNNIFSNDKMIKIAKILILLIIIGSNAEKEADLKSIIENTKVSLNKVTSKEIGFVILKSTADENGVELKSIDLDDVIKQNFKKAVDTATNEKQIQSIVKSERNVATSGRQKDKKLSVDTNKEIKKAITDSKTSKFEELNITSLTDIANILTKTNKNVLYDYDFFGKKTKGSVLLKNVTNRIGNIKKIMNKSAKIIGVDDIIDLKTNKLYELKKEILKLPESENIFGKTPEDVIEEIDDELDDRKKSQEDEMKKRRDSFNKKEKLRIRKEQSEAKAKAQKLFLKQQAEEKKRLDEEKRLEDERKKQFKKNQEAYAKYLKEQKQKLLQQQQQNVSILKTPVKKKVGSGKKKKKYKKPSAKNLYEFLLNDDFDKL